MKNVEFWVMRRVMSRGKAAARQLGLNIHAARDIGANNYVTVGDNVCEPVAGPFGEAAQAIAIAQDRQKDFPSQVFHVVLNADL